MVMKLPLSSDIVQGLGGSIAANLLKGVTGAIAVTSVEVVAGNLVIRFKDENNNPQSLIVGSGGVVIGNESLLLTRIPADSEGNEGDTALVRLSSIVVHAYKKVSGMWERQWAFSGGEAILLVGNLAVVPDRIPAADPSGTGFLRRLGISGYDPVTQDDVDHANPSGGTVSNVSQLRGGNHGTATLGRVNIIGAPSLTFTYSVGVYVWFGIEKSGALGLSISGVTQSGVDIPIVEQDDLTLIGSDYKVYRTTSTYTQSEVDSADYELAIMVDAAFPHTYNRYAVVTDNPVPTAADFLGSNAQFSSGISILIPNSGWVDGRGYLHFALPATQAAPTIAGLPGSINLIDDFDVRSIASTVTLNGDSMRTLSSSTRVFQMTDLYSLFPWIVR